MFDLLSNWDYCYVLFDKKFKTKRNLRHGSFIKMFSVELGVFFLTLFLAAAENQDSCDEYEYRIHKANNRTKWDEEWGLFGLELMIDNGDGDSNHT